MVSLTRDEVSFEFHEKFILRGYRAPNSSLKACVLSVFRLDNNETLNFWTHFIPFLYLIYEIYKINKEYDFINDNFIWPFLIFLSTAAFYLLMSALAHAFNCMSSIARHICFILDYISISMYGMGCCIGYKSYCLLNIPDFLIEFTNNYYITLTMLIMFACNTISCASRFVISHKKRSLMRILSFSFQYAIVSLPFFYRLISNTTLISNDSDKYFILQLICALISALIYVSHIPERYFPGIFDIIGHSHQLFHISTALCTYFQMKGLHYEMLQFKPIIIDNNSNDTLLLISSSSSLDLTSYLNNAKYYNAFIILLCLFINSLILIYYYYKALYFNPWNKLETTQIPPSACDFCNKLNEKSKTKKN